MRRTFHEDTLKQKTDVTIFKLVHVLLSLFQILSILNVLVNKSKLISINCNYSKLGQVRIMSRLFGTLQNNTFQYLCLKFCTKILIKNLCSYFCNDKQISGPNLT